MTLTFLNLVVVSGILVGLIAPVAAREHAHGAVLRIHDNERIHVKFAHHLLRILEGAVQPYAKRLLDESGIGAADLLEHGKPPLKRERLRRDGEPAFTLKSDRKFGPHYGLHIGGDEGNVERDAGKVGRKVADLRPGADVGVAFREIDVPKGDAHVERQAFLREMLDDRILLSLGKFQRLAHIGAGSEGVEPPLAVLETAVLPLNDDPLGLPYSKKKHAFVNKPPPAAG